MPCHHSLYAGIHDFWAEPTYPPDAFTEGYDNAL